MFLTNKRSKFGLVSFKDVYFSPDTKNISPKTDITHFYQCAVPIAGAKEFQTLMIDLNRKNEEIFNSFDRRTKTEIKRAEAKIEHFKNPDTAMVEQLVSFYNHFAEGKGIIGNDGLLLRRLSEAGRLVISTAKLPDYGDEVCIMHAHYFDENRVHAYLSGSKRFDEQDAEVYNLIARANRLMHWEDMLYFKAMGIPMYDFGGYFASTDKKNKGVNEFKHGFGGTIVVEYNFFKPHTLKGKIAMSVRKPKE